MSKVFISTAPGRVCLFGDHQDYLGLPVIACAIDRQLEIRATPNLEKVFRIHQLDLDAVVTIPIDAPETKAPLGDYLRLSLQVLRRYGCIPDRGFDVQISSTIPINAGLSSSSALTIAWVKFLIAAFGIDMPVHLSKWIQLAHEIEVLEQGTAGGKMDHYAIVLGGLIFVETRIDEVFAFEAPIDQLIIGVSGDPKFTSDILATRKQGAIDAIEQVRAIDPNFEIATANVADLDRFLPLIDPPLQPFFQAAMVNHEITKQARQFSRQQGFNLPSLGRLMNQHHQQLRDNLKITTPRIDAMVEGALSAGAFGAKIVGSGGGGCIVALAPPEQQEAVIKAIKSAGAVDAFAASIGTGAKLNTLEV